MPRGTVNTSASPRAGAQPAAILSSEPEMPRFTSFADLRVICNDLPAGNAEMAAAVLRHDAQLTKPPGSLGRLEDVVAWLAHWQNKNPPTLDRVETLIFAGNHGVVAQGVSA